MVLALVPAFTLQFFDDGKALAPDHDAADCDRAGKLRRSDGGTAIGTAGFDTATQPWQQCRTMDPSLLAVLGAYGSTAPYTETPRVDPPLTGWCDCCRNSC